MEEDGTGVVLKGSGSTRSSEVKSV
uniref:Uncharacterized protein n=1 Tax=Anguilla anguilla TaxID=7936 RepID=A0A0E9XEF1_ANGAN